jgi:hypothetical protein
MTAKIRGNSPILYLKAGETFGLKRLHLIKSKIYVK